MSEKEVMDLKLHMIVVIAEKELMVLLNLDHITIKDYRKDKKPYQDHTEVSYVLDVSNQESSELSY
jgi:hypothetical protein